MTPRSCARVAWAISGLALVVLCVIGFRLQVDLFRGDVLCANDNTWRDFTVYGELRLGHIPLQGPNTSVGGHHGFLAYWIFGVWSLFVHGYKGLQILCAAIYLLSMAGSWLIARRVASAHSAALGLGVFLCTMFMQVTTYPNHIILMTLASAMALYGLLRAREGGRWALACVLGVVLCMGCHRYGIILLGLVLALDRRFQMGLLRSRWAWSPLALYLLVPAAVMFLGNPDATRPGKILEAVEHMDPLYRLRTMAFLNESEDSNKSEDPAPLLKLVETILVMGAFGLAWRRSPGRDGQVILVFYGIHWVFLLFYKYDGQYYLPMFALLPAVLGMGLDAAWERDPRWGLGLALALAVTEIRACAVEADALRAEISYGQADTRSVGDELAAVAALDDLGVGGEELRRRTWFEPLTEKRPLDYLHHLFSRDLSAPGRNDRCLRIEWADHRPRAGVVRSAAANGFRVDVLPIAGGGCDRNVDRYGPPIWYFDVADGRFSRF